MSPASAATGVVMPGGESPLAVWPFTMLNWPMGAGPELYPYSSRTFAFMFVFLLFSGNLGRAFFPLLLGARVHTAQKTRAPCRALMRAPEVVAESEGAPPNSHPFLFCVGFTCSWNPTL